MKQIFTFLIAIALYEAVFLAAVHFSMKNIVTSCDHGGTKGGPDVNVFKLHSLFTSIWVMLVTYCYDVKHGSSAFWLFQDLR